MTDKSLIKAAKDIADRTGWSMNRALRVAVRMNQPKRPIKIEKNGQVALF